MASTHWTTLLCGWRGQKQEPLPIETSLPDNRPIFFLRIGIVVLLCALIAGLGAGSYTLLSNVESRHFRNQFESLTSNIASSLDASLAAKITAASLVNNMYRTAISNGYVGAAPNITLPGYESMMNDVIKMAALRSLQFAPLVKASQRKQWESYATSHLYLLNGPQSLNHSTDGSWTVKDGIFNFSPDRSKKVSAISNVVGSTHPDWLFPLWQIAPIMSNAAVVMLDVHEEQSTVVDTVIATMRPAVTDAFQLSQDGSNLRPSSIMYSPVRSPLSGDNNRLIGLSASVFTWDQMFANAIPPSFGRVYCVVTTKSQQFTFALDGATVSVLGKGDLHDATLDGFRSEFSVPSFSVISASDYSFALYPSQALYGHYVTATPRDACMVVVFVIVFTALLVMLYSHYVNERENRLIEEVKRAAITAASRLATLESKKTYVRYISHEIRTPMNAASLGIQLLEKSLSKSTDSQEKNKNLETLSDMRSAFDMALAILNDLLTFDKLDSGNLMVEPSYVNALSYVKGCLKLSMLQAREKEVKLSLDLRSDGLSRDELSDPWHSALVSMLNSNDLIYIDKNKIDQVIRNLISNAVKFTPEGKNVTVRVRKVADDSAVRFQATVNDLDAGGSVVPSDGNQRVDSTAFANGNVIRSVRKQCGVLVINVIDEGVGIAPDNIKKLFKEIVQFNPGKLQGGGGSGLGMMISKGIVDMHGGDLSVNSEGEGEGTTFTLKLPLYQKEQLSLRNSSDALAGFSGHGSIRINANDVSKTGLDRAGSIASVRQLDLDLPSFSTHRLRCHSLHLSSEKSRHIRSVIPEDGIPLGSLKVLVVDDSKLNRRMLMRLLEADDHRCSEAEDGVQAIKMVRENTYDAILIDYVMPNMNGPTATKEIRALGYKGVIFGVTGNALSEDIAIFLNHGVNQVLIKPVDANNLQSSFIKHGLISGVCNV